MDNEKVKKLEKWLCENLDDGDLIGYSSYEIAYQIVGLLEDNSSQRQVDAMVMPCGDDMEERDYMAKECEELKQLIRDILPYTRFDEAEEWIEPLLKKHKI